MVAARYRTDTEVLRLLIEEGAKINTVAFVIEDFYFKRVRGGGCDPVSILKPPKKRNNMTEE
jgi:hypothetical protein